jgi:hypothetical protein
MSLASLLQRVSSLDILRVIRNRSSIKEVPQLLKKFFNQKYVCKFYSSHFRNVSTDPLLAGCGSLGIRASKLGNHSSRSHFLSSWRINVAKVTFCMIFHVLFLEWSCTFTRILWGSVWCTILYIFTLLSSLLQNRLILNLLYGSDPWGPEDDSGESKHVALLM